MIIVLNGPLGVGKSTLGEALSESIEGSVYLDGDFIVAANPQPADSQGLLHSAIELLVNHFRNYGYRHFVICHYWESPDALDDLKRCLLRVDTSLQIRCFLTWLPLEENLARIHKRQTGRAVDELDHDLETVRHERRVLSRWTDSEVGEFLDVSPPVNELVEELVEMLRREPGGG